MIGGRIGDYNNGGSARVMKLKLTVDGKLKRLPDGPDLPNQLWYASLIEWNGQLVVTGGYSGDHQDSTYILNTRQSPATWVHRPNLNTARYRHFSFLLGDTVYVGCGYYVSSSLSSVEMMDLSLTNSTWTLTTNYPHKVAITTSMLALYILSISNNN